MFKIIKKKILSKDVFLFEIEALQIAKKACAGQFVIVNIDEFGERIPLTIADFDREKGTVTIIFQAIGASTKLLSEKNEGDYIKDFVGPLGQKSEIYKTDETIICVGGGIGIAPIYPIVRSMKEIGNKVISIIGARNSGLLILEDELIKISDEVIITTDDGSKGIKGFVTDALKSIIDRGEKIAQVTAIGPVIMMKTVSELTKKYGIKTIVSLNPIMIDGTGMCGGCRVQVGETTKFACIDGPEFDGHLVDFASLMLRQRMYRKEEAEARDHVCNLFK
ncbi:sulfide/dihydroorotate dehydrogenase-like FAD/NAD-binding protein [bacterium]|nr:sulfide/dihydroorotate dehydrogenase-like FAD/NAD-binding protein [bacterium]